LPLRFAISIKGFWGVFTSEFLQSNNGKITISDFLGESSNSYLDQEFETCSYMFTPPLAIKSVYSHNHPKGMGICFEPYGELISYELIVENTKIFRAKGKHSQYIGHTMIIEALQDRLANENQNISQENGYAIITENLTEVHVIPEYQFFLAMINHTRIEYVEKSDNVSLVATKKEYPFPTVEHIRAILSDLVDKGLNITVFKGANGYPFEVYRHKFWTNNVR
jgi:hypothetical protein